MKKFLLIVTMLFLTNIMIVGIIVTSGNDEAEMPIEQPSSNLPGSIGSNGVMINGLTIE